MSVSDRGQRRALATMMPLSVLKLSLGRPAMPHSTDTDGVNGVGQGGMQVPHPYPPPHLQVGAQGGVEIPLRSRGQEDHTPLSATVSDGSGCRIKRGAERSSDRLDR